MSRQLCVALAGIVYHLLNRATSRQAIFHSPADHAAFQGKRGREKGDTGPYLKGDTAPYLSKYDVKGKGEGENAAVNLTYCQTPCFSSQSNTMPSRLPADLGDIVYHALNHAPGRQAIFHTPANSAAFQKILQQPHARSASTLLSPQPRPFQFLRHPPASNSVPLPSRS
jgi:hypothetical protein